MQPGDVIDLEITGIAHGGTFVGRHGEGDGSGGRVVFAPDAIPGERVRVRLTDTSRSAFWRAETLEVLDPSPHRRPHVWAEAELDRAPEDRPGGADFGHITLAHGRELKARVAREALARIGRIERDVEVRAIGDAESGEGWRTRLGLHVDAAGRVGPVAARSHRVIETTRHPLAAPEIAEAVRSLGSLREGRVDFVLPSDGRVRVIEKPEAGDASAAAHDEIVQRVGERSFTLAGGGFWQVHRESAGALTGAVGALLRADPPDPDGEHLDLYGGVGLFAATLAEAAGSAARVTSVEAVGEATGFARRNLAEFAGATAETGRVDRWLEHVGRDADGARRARIARGTVVLDPPRAGAGKRALAALTALAPRSVVYVACDPVAFARDARILVDAGYELGSLSGLDMFPNAHHLELVAAFTRTPARL